MLLGIYSINNVQRQAVNGGEFPYKEIKIPTIGLSLEDGELC
jgi:hypothetical protein